MPESRPQQDLDKALVKQSFNKAAETYDDVAVLQRMVGRQLVERLDWIKQDFKHIIDIGAGTGDCIGQLANKYKGAQILCLDLAYSMLLKARNKQPWIGRLLKNRQSYVCGDVESLPIANDSMELVFSNLALQWCNDIEHTFSELFRILKPGGLLMFTTLGPDTLKELRQSWQAVDRGRHVHAFLDMHDIGDALLYTRFADPVMDVDHMTLTYGDVMTMMRELKALGAHNAQSQRATGMTAKAKLRQMQQHYEQFRVDGKLPASYEVIFGHAWKAEQQVNGPREVAVQIE